MLEPEGTTTVHPPGLTAAEGLPDGEGAVGGMGSEFRENYFGFDLIENLEGSLYSPGTSISH